MTNIMLAALATQVLLLLIAVVCVAALAHLGRRLDRLESTPLFYPAETAQSSPSVRARLLGTAEVSPSTEGDPAHGSAGFSPRARAEDAAATDMDAAASDRGDAYRRRDSVRIADFDPTKFFQPADTAQGVGASSQSPSLLLADPLAVEESGADGRPPTSVPHILYVSCAGCGELLVYNAEELNAYCPTPGCHVGHGPVTDAYEALQ